MQTLEGNNFMNVVRHSNVKSLRAIILLAVVGCMGLIVSCSFMHKQPENKGWNGIIIPAGAEPLTVELIQRIAHSVTAPDSLRPIEGNVYLGQVVCNRSKPQDHLERAVINLGEALNRYTNLDVKVDAHLSFGTFKHHETPFIYISADTTFSLTEIEQKKFCEYLKDGGFAFIDNTAP